MRHDSRPPDAVMLMELSALVVSGDLAGWSQRELASRWRVGQSTLRRVAKACLEHYRSATGAGAEHYRSTILQWMPALSPPPRSATGALPERNRNDTRAVEEEVDRDQDQDQDSTEPSAPDTPRPADEWWERFQAAYAKHSGRALLRRRWEAPLRRAVKREGADDFFSLWEWVCTCEHSGNWHRANLRGSKLPDAILRKNGESFRGALANRETIEDAPKPTNNKRAALEALQERDTMERAHLVLMGHSRETH